MTEPQMMADPLVSVVIDNYNYGRYLPQAIESALHQSYPNIEVIVVDDGSTDNSREILAGYRGRIVPVLKENGGQASAFNVGFAHARGQFLMFLDSDDVLLPDIVERAVELFRCDPGVGTVAFRLEIIDAAGSRTGRLIPASQERMIGGDLREHVLTCPKYTCWPPTSGSAFSSSVVAEILPMPEEPFRLCADSYLCRAAALLAEVRVLGDVVGGLYRVHGANGYQRAGSIGRAGLDLAYIRKEMVQFASTYRHVERFAGWRGLWRSPPAQRVWDREVGFLTLRMASRRLDPEGHPWAEDGIRSLAWRGAVAACRSPELSLTLKCLHLAWFGAVAVAPRRLGRWLAERKLCPETRGGVGRLVALLGGSA